MQSLLQRAQFPAVLLREQVEDRFSPRRQRDVYLPPIFRIQSALHQTGQHTAIYQSDSSVMPNLKRICQVRDRCPFALWLAFDRQQELMLLWSQALRMGRRFAEVQKAAQGPAEGCERFKVRFAQFIHERSSRRLELYRIVI